MTALRSEVEACRRITIGCGALTIGGMHRFSRLIVLPLFGNYAGALRIPDMARHSDFRAIVLRDIGSPAHHCRAG